ncbi:glycosyltransferase [Alloalcanivorax xenomutans]|uniref:glycosyltransferase n=1 Tax=Alloalcanivorax xenomutans TaxID=1094342 RepID=UPI003BAC12E8
MTSIEKLLFIHDHKFYRSLDNFFYSEGKLPLSAFDRFLEVSKSVTVLCRSEEVNNTSGLVLSSSDVVEFCPVEGQRWTVIWGKKFFHNLRHLWNLVYESDFVVLRTPCVFSVFAFPLLMLQGKPYAVEVVGDAYESIYNAGGGSARYKLVATFFELYTKMVVRFSKGAIYVTKNQLQKKYKNRSLMGYASNVSINEVEKSVLEARINYIRGLEKPKVYDVGVIGSFNNNYKGIDVLIDAVYWIRNKYDIDVRVRVLGTGRRELLNPIIQRCSAQEWVLFDGRKDKVGVVKWLDGLDLYCQPSRTEGLPRSLIEAMSRGCPAIASNVGGMSELLPASRLVSSDDPRALAEAIFFLIDSPLRMVDDASKNFETAKQYYSDILEKRRNKFWNDVVSSLR